MTFEAILSRIAAGEDVPGAELLPYLSLERREQRESVNTLLAEAYLDSGREGHLEQAKVFVERAWLLSRFTQQLLPLYTRIHAALNDIGAIREAYKRVGMMMAWEGNLSEAIRYFDLWQYAYVKFRSVDKYEYDFDILDCIDRIAQTHQLPTSQCAGMPAGGKLRVAYLVRGIIEPGSILVAINLFYAQFHDRARFEPIFFALESESAVAASAAGQKYLQLFGRHGCKLVMAPNVRDREERLLAVGRMIADSRPHILVTSAALASFEHYFITALRPAPVVIGLVQGPPQQFAPLTLDWGIAWSRHPLMDCPASCSLVNMAHSLPSRDGIVPLDLSEFDIPDHAFLLASAGRYVKFQQPEFWKAIIDLLAAHPETFYLAMGVEESQIPFLSSMLSPVIRSRIRFIGWRGNDYLRLLRLVNTYIDTFPSGGGGTLVDAMALGIPVVSFRNNYLRQYDQTDWSPAEEIFDIPELIVSRGDFDEMKAVVSRLIDDVEYRRDLAQRCEASVQEIKGDPARSVRDSEDIYVRVFEQELSGNKLLDPREIEIEEITRQSRPRTGHIARTAYQLKRALWLGERILDRIAEKKKA